MSFLQEHFCLNIYYRNILLYFGFELVKNHKIKKIFFPRTSKKSAIQNNPLMQLHLIFHKRLMKTNGKSENSKVLAVFQQLRKLWKGGGGKFISLLSLFLSVHIDFQYKLKSHGSLFIVTFYLFSSIA